MNEADIVRILTRGHGHARALGFDDDVAVVDGSIVASADMLVEDVDFRLKTFTAADIAHKALAVNLSDLAAAGASPGGFLLCLALPMTIGREWLETFSTALHEGATVAQCPLLGGDLSKTIGPMVINVTVFGKTPRLLRRRVGAVGDTLAVSGELGAAAAGFRLLEDDVAGYDRLKLKQRRPQARLDLAVSLAQNQDCASCIDLSDGLAADLPRLLPKGLSARIDFDALPIAADTRAAARALKVAPERLALSGGEDFELLCVFKRGAGMPQGFTAIGEIVASGGTELGEAFDHFGGSGK